VRRKNYLTGQIWREEMFNYELQAENKDRTYWQGKYASDFIQELEYYNQVRYKGRGRIIDTVTGQVVIPCS
jgi:hypothetical protein